MRGISDSKPGDEMRFEWKPTRAFGREQIRVHYVEEEGREIIQIELVSQNVFHHLGKLFTKHLKLGVHTVVLAQIKDKKFYLQATNKKTDDIAFFRHPEKLKEEMDKALNQLLKKAGKLKLIDSHKKMLFERINNLSKSLSTDSIEQLDNKLKEIKELQGLFKKVKHLAKERSIEKINQLVKDPLVKDLSELPIETSVDSIEMAKVPESGIRVGLPNIQGALLFGNTCWLNSTLKFLSCTTYYDSMLTNPPPEGKEALQSTLRGVINKLREGNPITKKEYLELLTQIKSNVTRFKEIGKQEDATEFLGDLISTFNWTPDSKATFAYAYSSENDSDIKYGRVEDPTQQIQFVLPLSTGDGDGVNLSDLLNESSEVEVKPDEGSSENRTFIKNNFPIELPEDLMILINRTRNKNQLDSKILVSRPMQRILSALPTFLSAQLMMMMGTVNKISAPILLDKNKQIVFIVYSPIYDEEDHVIGKEPLYKYYYQIEATLKHFGDGTRGHFVCEERTKNGEFLEHSDLHVTDVNPDQFGINGYYLRLHLVKKEEISDKSSL